MGEGARRGEKEKGEEGRNGSRHDEEKGEREGEAPTNQGAPPSAPPIVAR